VSDVIAYVLGCSRRNDPASVDKDDIKLYQDTMEDLVDDVLLGQKKDLFEIRPIKYDEFLSRVNKLKSSNH
jgi:hypothetical protein